MWPTTGLCPKRWHEGGLDGRSTGGLGGRPPVLKPLSTKVFQRETGGWEVKIIRYKPRPRPRPLKGWGVPLCRSHRPWEGEGLGGGSIILSAKKILPLPLTPPPTPPLKGWGERGEGRGDRGVRGGEFRFAALPAPGKGRGWGRGDRSVRGGEWLRL